MLHKSTLDFLKNLKKNNNREWFVKNKPAYEAAKDNVTKFVQAVLDECKKHDKSLEGIDATKCLFRIYRDVRFSKNKEPYKTNMGAYFNAEGKNSKRAGFYIHIDPTEAFIAAGLYGPEAPELKKVRQEIDYNTAEFKKILANKAFKSFWGTLEEMKLANPPKGYDKTHPEIELLKHTSFIVSHKFSQSEILEKNFIKTIAAAYKTMLPLKHFLDAAVS